MINHFHSSTSNHQITTRAPLHIMLLLISVFHSAPPPYAAAQPPSEPTPVYLYSVQGSFNSSLTVVLLVLFSCFFIFGFFSFYIRQCIQGTPAPASESGQQSVHNRRRHHPRGLHSAVVDSYPVFSYSTVKHLKMGKGALECAVCISEFEEDDTLRLLPKCEHVFHQDCIDVWLTSHSTCPVCRFDLTKPRPSPVDSVQSRGSSEPTYEVEPPISEDIVVPSLQVIIADRPQIGGRFSRSHSMGNLLIEDCERYTLRLPEEVKKRIVKFNRAKSTGEVVRKCGGEGSSRPDRWGLRMTPFYISRTISLGKGEGSTSSSNNSAPV